MRILTKFAIIALLSALFFTFVGSPEAAHAATSNASAIITVTSTADGGAITAANVTLRSSALPFPVTVVTNSYGNAEFPNVPVGDYSVTVSSITYDPSASISIGTLSAGQSYTQTISLTPDPSLMGIQSLTANNNSSSAGTYDGTVSWSTYGTIPNGSEMALQYLDDSDAPLGSVSSSVYYDSMTTYYSVDVANQAIPAGASRIGVTVLNSGSSVIAFKSTALWSWSLHSPSGFHFHDSDATGGGISASVTWNKPNDESAIAGYRIYYWTKGASFWKYWDAVSKNTTGSYQYSFSSLPTDTVSILIGINNSRGEEMNSYPTAAVVDNRLADTGLNAVYSPSLPLPSGIANNNYTYDLQTINGSINWAQPADRSQIKGYNLYFSDANGKQLQAIGTIYPPYNAESMVIFNLDQSLPIKSGASQFAIYSLGLDGTESAPVYVPFKYYPYGTSLPQGLRFADLDGQANQLRGYLTWTKAADESAISGYDAYFLDSSYNKVGDRIGETMKGAATVLTLPAGLTIPAGADKIGLFVKDTTGNLSTSSISYSFVDSKSQADVAAAARGTYFPGISTVDIKALLYFLQHSGSSSPFSVSDIQLFLSLIDAKMVSQ